MSWGLMCTTVDKKPSIGQFVNINTDNEYDSTPKKVKVNRCTSIVHADYHEAEAAIPDTKDVIYAIPFLGSEIERSPKLISNQQKKFELFKKIETLINESKPRALKIKSKTCFSCGSKILQNHARIEQQQPWQVADCPCCGGRNYLLTATARKQIAAMNQKIDHLNKEDEKLRGEIVRNMVKKGAKVAYLVGGWIHESELPRGY